MSKFPEHRKVIIGMGSDRVSATIYSTFVCGNISFAVCIRDIGNYNKVIVITDTVDAEGIYRIALTGNSIHSLAALSRTSYSDMIITATAKTVLGVHLGSRWSDIATTVDLPELCSKLNTKLNEVETVLLQDAVELFFSSCTTLDCATKKLTTIWNSLDRRGDISACVSTLIAS